MSKLPVECLQIKCMNTITFTKYNVKEPNQIFNINQSKFSQNVSLLNKHYFYKGKNNLKWIPNRKDVDTEFAMSYKI